jgi:hypothetical protein
MYLERSFLLPCVAVYAKMVGSYVGAIIDEIFFCEFFRISGFIILLSGFSLASLGILNAFMSLIHQSLLNKAFYRS